MTDYQITLKKHSPAFWRITFDNPPINLWTFATIQGINKVLDEMEADEHAKVLVFDSANKDFFIAHLDVTQALIIKESKGKSGFNAWTELTLRIHKSPIICIASIRGRTRGGGSEFILALDMVFASKEKAIFNQLEVGAGCMIGGGGLEHLVTKTSRSRIMEIILSSEDFQAEVAEKYGWINRAIPDAELDNFVYSLATRIGSFNKSLVAEAKAFINDRAGGRPSGYTLEASYDYFLETTSRPYFQGTIEKMLALGLQQHSDFELNVAKYLPELGV